MSDAGDRPRLTYLQIDGLKLIRLNSCRINEPDDPSYPYKLVANLRPPEFMQVTFIMLCGGTEELVVRSMTRRAINQFVGQNDLYRHPRLRQMTISGPDGVEVSGPMSLTGEGKTVTICIHSTGSDSSGDGSSAKPYRTRQRALRDVPGFIQPGRTYIVDNMGVEADLLGEQA